MAELWSWEEFPTSKKYFDISICCEYLLTASFYTLLLARVQMQS